MLLMYLTVLHTVYELFSAAVPHVLICLCKQSPGLLSCALAPVRLLSKAGVWQGKTCTRSPWPAKQVTFYVLFSEVQLCDAHLCKRHAGGIASLRVDAAGF